MSSHSSQSPDPLLGSSQLYYFITNEQGEILNSNKPASILIPLANLSEEKLKLFLSSLFISGTLNILYEKGQSNKIITWEIFEKKDANGQKVYQWIAPLIKQNEQEEAHKLFFKNPLPAWIVDVNTCLILESNQAATDFYGFSEREFKNKNFCNLLAACTAGGERINKEPALVPDKKVILDHAKKGGEKISVELHCTRFIYLQKEVYAVTAVDITDKIAAQKKLFTEIAERKIIGDRNRQLANLVEQTAEVLTAADMDFKPTTWNKAAEEIFGITADKAIGHNLREYIDFNYHNESVERVRQRLRTVGYWRGEMFFNRFADKKQITLLVNFKLLKDEAGIPLGYLVAGTNITEIKEAELKIKESDKRFQEVADSAPVGIWISDINNKLTYVNRQLKRLAGFELEHFVALTWAALLHPDDLETCQQKFDEHFRKRIPLTIVYRFKTANGAYRWVQDCGIPRLLEDGTFLGFIGSIVDIHETKMQEEELGYQATVLENVSDIIVSTDLKYNIRSWNNIAEQFFGWKAVDVFGHPFSKFVTFDFGAITRIEAISILEHKGIWRGEVSYINHKNETKHLLHTIKYIYNRDGSKIGAMAVSRDITERKEAEEKLRQSELFYRHLIADSLDGMLLSDASGTITFASPSLRHILQYEVEEVLGKNCFSFVHPDDSAWAWESFQREVRENPVIKSLVIRLRRKDGEWVWCMVRGHNLLQNPHVRSIAVYFHDDTLRKNASDALKQSEQRFRNLVRDLQVGVMLQDREGTILMCNNALLEILESKESALTGKKIWNIFTDVIDESGKKVKITHTPAFRALNSKIAVNYVMGVLLKSGKRLWMIVNADPILDEQGNVINIVCSITNITERKELEQKLVQEKINSQKLLTQATIDGQEKERREIGKELHDNIGQQLTTIKLYLDLAKSSANDSNLEMIYLSLRSVSDVINEIRRMSRSLMPPTLGDLGLIDSISDVIESIKRTQKLRIEVDHIEFNEDLLPDNGKLMFFRILQEQLNNIIKHAAATEITITLKNDDKNHLLQIKDNGCGFAFDKVRKGLGLTNIKNRAELFGGKMEIISSVGKGCTINILVPAILQPVYQ